VRPVADKDLSVDNRNLIVVQLYTHTHTHIRKKNTFDNFSSTYLYVIRLSNSIACTKGSSEHVEQLYRCTTDNSRRYFKLLPQLETYTGCLCTRHNRPQLTCYIMFTCSTNHISYINLNTYGCIWMLNENIGNSTFKIYR